LFQQPEVARADRSHSNAIVVHWPDSRTTSGMEPAGIAGCSSSPFGHTTERSTMNKSIARTEEIERFLNKISGQESGKGNPRVKQLVRRIVALRIAEVDART
jgi:hypothetical protein